MVVTGGTRGLGLGIVEALLARGAHVTVVARDPTRLADVRRLGAAARPGDLTDPALMSAVVADVKPSVLILNAGATPVMAPIDEQSWAAFTAVWDTDVKAVRDMLADDVRLDLVNRLQRQGRGEVAEYFHRYAQALDWTVVAGAVDGRPALLVFETRDEGTPVYFILLNWHDDGVAGIRDFRFARYAIDGAEVLTVR